MGARTMSTTLISAIIFDEKIGVVRWRLRKGPVGVLQTDGRL